MKYYGWIGLNLPENRIDFIVQEIKEILSMIGGDRVSAIMGKVLFINHPGEEFSSEQSVIISEELICNTLQEAMHNVVIEVFKW